MSAVGKGKDIPAAIIQSGILKDGCLLTKEITRQTGKWRRNTGEQRMPSRE
jgi:hypothetical protein